MNTVAPFVSRADPTPAQATDWAADWAAVLTPLGRHVARSEARAHLRTDVIGLLSPSARKNGGQVAEHAGAATPYALQPLRGRATWNADAVRDDLHAYVMGGPIWPTLRACS